MNEYRILEELIGLLEQNGVTIRKEPLGGNGGGLCTVKEKSIFFVDIQASSTDMAVLCAEAVVEKVNIENIYILPEVRQFIEKHCDIQQEQ